MRTNLKQIFSFFLLPLAVIFFSGCGPSAKTTEKIAAPAISTTEKVPAEEKTQTPEVLPPLPNDNKRAIDNELQGIRETLDETESTLSKDTPDSGLGF